MATMTYDFPHSSYHYTVTSSATVACNAGFIFPHGTREETITCLYNNTWSNSLSDCISEYIIHILMNLLSKV